MNKSDVVNIMKCSRVHPSFALFFTDYASDLISWIETVVYTKYASKSKSVFIGKSEKFVVTILSAGLKGEKHSKIQFPILA